jgi:3-isopropylmalate/(R)-2-methylmalate dehydratase small subunit
MITGRLHRLGDNVDTDAILPGRYLALKQPATLATHCLEALDPGFRARVQPGDILLAGRNFGSGSSREHAVVALKACGIAAIIVASAARIFFRNAINLGLPVLTCPETVAELDDQTVAGIDPLGPTIVQADHAWRAQPLGPEVLAILAAGGLMAKVRKDLALKAERNPVHG